RRAARRLGLVGAALAAVLPLAAVAPAALAPAGGGATPQAVAADAGALRPAVDAVADEDSEQSCTQEGGYAVPRWPTALTAYDAGRVWAHATGRGVRVAVVDSGVNV